MYDYGRHKSLVVVATSASVRLQRMIRISSNFYLAAERLHMETTVLMVLYDEVKRGNFQERSFKRNDLPSNGSIMVKGEAHQAVLSSPRRARRSWNPS
jgi:hypothetical protein